jgi:hypothetical protein
MVNEDHTLVGIEEAAFNFTWTQLSQIILLVDESELMSHIDTQEVRD